MRWRRSADEIITAGAFVPAVERTSMIAPLIFATIDLALNQANAWRGKGKLVPMAINLSARMLDDEGLASRVIGALEQYSLPPQSLTLEVTESSLMSNVETAKRVVAELSKSGIAVSLDDFGTGYTSLRHLGEFDFAEVKLDKAFVEGLQVFCKGFGTKLVAKGIEDLGSIPMLMDLGCDFGQGYAIAHPMPADKIEDLWLRSGTCPYRKSHPDQRVMQTSEVRDELNSSATPQA